MHTLIIVLCSMNIIVSLLNAVAQEGKRGAYISATIGWTVALISIVM